MTSSSCAKDIFLDIIEHPPEEWDQRLADRCKDDRTLLKHVEDLLKAHEAAGVFLSTPTVAGNNQVTENSESILERPGSHVGQYTLVENIGEGGFGVVFRADQSAPVRRSVALKIIKPGMDTRQVVARLKAEQQVLAMLDHPHIAKVFDADTTETGRPFFVMELVDGIAITRFCDKHKLDLSERLGLFDLVCDAVRHAHQKGVIHRDIKPNNVLVSGTRDRPLPKLIDFGVAKAMNERLTDHTSLTHDHQIVGTPQYMSPEQATPTDQDIDTRSDVYALGVLLYEMLTGTNPIENDQLRGAKLADIQRMICEEDPPKPSTRISDRIRNEPRSDQCPSPAVAQWSRKLKGDVDTIVMKALHKDRERRYASVERLSDDVRRFLLGLPIAARGDSVSYRTLRFVKRNSTTVMASVLVLVSLVGAFISTYRSEKTATQQRDVAIANLYDAYRAQARAAQSSKRPGRRSESLQAITAAAAIRPSRDLRDQAIGCMTLSDLAIEKSHGTFRHATTLGLQYTDRFAYKTEEDHVAVRYIDNTDRLHSFPTPWKDADPIFWSFSPSGTYLCVDYFLSETWKCAVWHVDSQDLLFELDSGKYRSHPTFSDKEDWLLAGNSTGTITQYELPTGRTTRDIAAGISPRAMAICPENKYLAVAHQQTQQLTILSVESGASDSSVPIGTRINALQWSPDGSRLAGAGRDHVIHLWDTESWAIVRQLIGHQGEVRKVFWHPNGDFLASNSWDNTARVWNARSGEQLFEPLQSWSLGGFGDTFFARDRQGELATWKLVRSQELRRMYSDKSFGPIATPSVTDDSEYVLTAGRNGLCFWNVDDTPSRCIEDILQVSSARSVDENTVLFVDSDGLNRWTRTSNDTMVGTTELIWSRSNLRRFDLAQDRSIVVICSRDSTFVYDLQTNTERALTRTGNGIIRPRLSPDNRWLITGTWKGDPAHLWDLESDRMVQTFDGSHVIGDFSPDGRFLVITRGRDFRFFEVGTWSLIRTIERSIATDDLAGKLAFSPDGKLVALGKSRYSLTLVDMDTGNELAQLADASFLAQSELTFTPDGNKIVVATMDRVLQVWDLQRIRRELRMMNLDW